MNEPPVDPRTNALAAHVSPADREAVIAELTKRYANDQLTMDEFERRAAAVYAAASPAALSALTADLRQPLPMHAAGAGHVLNIGASLGSTVREGPIELPGRVEVRSFLGNVELDLTEAVFLPGVTEIALRAVMGNIEIQLPPYVGMEDHVDTVLGSFEYRRKPRATSWVEGSRVSSVVRFTGRVIMSNVEVTVKASGSSNESDDD